MEFKDVVKTRIATRKYKTDNVSHETLLKVLEYGRLAPTAKNIQPQRIIVCESEESLKKIDVCSPCRYGARACFIVCSDKNEAWSKDDYSTYEMDACIVATHLMLGAVNEGLDTIWIEMFDKGKLKSEFNLDDNIEPICLIMLGYKEDGYTSINHNNRKELSETVEFR